MPYKTYGKDKNEPKGTLFVVKGTSLKGGKMEMQMGADSVCLPKPVYVLAAASVAGKMEGEGPLGDCFDVICEDDRFGTDSWEKAESEMQKESLTIALGKANLSGEQLRYIFAGDLLGQTIASSFGLMEFQRPFFGLYGACSTVGEALSLAAMNVAAGYADLAAAVTSSHFGGAERQFRFPIEYANQRPLCSTWTVTGSGAYILGTTKSNIRITGITTGKIMDLGIRDAQNMGAAMAPAASALILNHMKDFGRTPKDYDAIITGDLGSVGSTILVELCSIGGCDIAGNHYDCGVEIFDADEQHTCSGGSGCGCSAITLASHYLPKIASGTWKRILFIPTGALLSPVSFNEGNSVPGIAHGVVIEHEEVA